MQNRPRRAYVKPDVPIAQAEVCKLLRVSPETAAKMVSFEEGYRSQSHEEDAYACAEVVQAYWDERVMSRARLVARIHPRLGFTVMVGLRETKISRSPHIAPQAEREQGRRIEHVPGRRV